MNLNEACQSAKEGNFISHNCFDSKQSMHEYNGNLYYEDGANLSANHGIEFLESQEWAQEGWYIKYPKEKIDIKVLKQLHEENIRTMLNSDKTYEDCIIRI